ncbi:MAG: methylenetetrahydrofolate--tRNA-(uracil(54)-C(5))-methyltransferase (FADH(2)-oxidizing) TrmFO [Pseudobdellovibrionaceae bacterium]
MKISVVGAGLAGSECALQLAALGYTVQLFEMRPTVSTPAHKSNDFAELVCSNSFGSLSETSAPGQLKWEAEQLGSFILKAAYIAQVPAGQALGVDREVFARTITKMIQNNPMIQIRSETITSLDQITGPCVIATGPLTHPDLIQSLQEHFGEKDFLYFFDAIAPILDTDSINMDIAWKADRYGKGSADYINCPLNKEQYFQFIDEIQKAKKIEPKHFETTSFFEGCMPIETMVERGPHTLRFGPMKPVGLVNPRTGKDAYATVQLRQDNKEATAYNMVGFQTRMSYGEQVRIFRTIPGLEKVEFLKLGSIHRNLYLNSPKLLAKNLSSKKNPLLFFAGQMTGVEGYFESTCIGLMVAKFMDDMMMKKSPSYPPRKTAMGSLLESITDETRIRHFQPTNINMSLFPTPKALDLKETPHLATEKTLKKSWQIQQARKALVEWASVNTQTQEQNSYSFYNAQQNLFS